MRRLIPVCAWCKKVRDDTGDWKMLEEYITEHPDASSFTHGICPQCVEKVSPQRYDEE